MSTGPTLQTWLAQQWQKRGVWAYLTWPLAWLYGWMVNRKRAAFDCGKQSVYRPAVPVIVIGNIYVGGTGKTPVTSSLAQQLTELGFKPGLVSRGYGRKPSPWPATGCGEHLDWQTYGDEPALIAKQAAIPVSVHADRGLAAEHLLARFPEVDVILSDDGLQHHRLARDFEILIQDERGIGNGWLLPAGPLREPATRLKEVDLVLQRVASDQLADSPVAAFAVALSQWRHGVTGRSVPAEHFANDPSLTKPVAAVAAIGVPGRFFNSIESTGLTLDDVHALKDHQPIDPAWLEREPAGTILITEKDAVKCSAINDERVWIAETAVRWWCVDIAAFFERKLAAAGIKRPR